MALNGLANFMTADLARDLSSDVLVMMTHSRPLIRKKATLVLYKVFLKYPEALRPAFPRLKDKLTDEDLGARRRVRCAADSPLIARAWQAWPARRSTSSVSSRAKTRKTMWRSPRSSSRHSQRPTTTGCSSRSSSWCVPRGVAGRMSS